MATNIIRSLSDADIELLRSIVRDVRGADGAGKSGSEEPPPQASPATMIVKCHEDGIEARSGTTPGHALCEVFNISHIDVTGSAKLIAVTYGESAAHKRKVRVYNNYLVPHPPGTTYITVTRDAFGKWLAPMPTHVFGYFTAGLSQGGSAAFEVITADSPPELSGMTLTVHDIYMNAGESILEDTKAEVVQYGERVIWRTVYCDVSDTLPT